MYKNYVCPECKGYLQVKDRIVFSVKRPNGKAGIILISPEIGDYSIVSHPEFTLAEGEKIDIFCPICHTNLGNQRQHPNLAKVILVDEDGKESGVYFSEIVGQRCTYRVSDESIEAYGDDLEEYTNFFGEDFRY